MSKYPQTTHGPLFQNSKEQFDLEAQEDMRKRLALHAAAPEMLAALKMWAEGMDTLGSIVTNKAKAELRALIDKAEGKE